jgi:hypothetical protein
VKRHFPLAFVLAVAAGPLQCATLERLSLDDMIAKSTAIVRATVGESYGAAAGPLIYTHYRLNVSETLKGAVPAAVDVAVPGGAAGHFRQTFAGSPAFKTGSEYVFFLWTGKSGLTQVIGLTQGLFALSNGSAADPVATRPAAAELMLDRTTGRPVKDQTLVMRLSDLRRQIAIGQAQGGAR